MMRDAGGWQRWPADCVEDERYQARARTCTNPTAFAASWQAGRRCTTDEAIAAAEHVGQMVASPVGFEAA